MTNQTRGWMAVIAGALLMGGCMQMRTLQTKAYGPTEEEARSLAKAQLDEQARELSTSAGPGQYQVTGSPHFSTKQLTQPGGGIVYEVTAKATAQPVKK